MRGPPLPPAGGGTAGIQPLDSLADISATVSVRDFIRNGEPNFESAFLVATQVCVLAPPDRGAHAPVRRCSTFTLVEHSHRADSGCSGWYRRSRRAAATGARAARARPAPAAAAARARQAAR